MQLTTADGVRLHFEVQGPSDGPAVVFANSLGTHLGLWEGIVELMPRGYRLVRMDKRGHGLSSCPPGPYSIAGLADDCSTILDHLGIRRSVFVGLSIGGLIGQAGPDPARLGAGPGAGKYRGSNRRPGDMAGANRPGPGGEAR